jgi:ribosomal-protein-alanine N-acetyltransferase
MVCLRPATVEDVSVLYALDQRCFRPGIAYSPQEFISILGSRRCISIVAEDAYGRVTGLWVLEVYHRYRTAHVLTVEVAPELRRSGLGRLLMAHLEQAALALGLPRVELEVAEDDPIARSFYLQLGYRVTGRVHRYYMGKIDAIRMEKMLTA